MTPHSKCLPTPCPPPRAPYTAPSGAIAPACRRRPWPHAPSGPATLPPRVVLLQSADRLSVEKLARYFIQTFKGVQRGEEAGNIKTTLGADLQALTEQQVFRFPSTFTFIFRAFASYDGIGKGLDKDFDLTKFAQPFINELTETDQYSSGFDKWADRLGKATGLNSEDVDIAISQPRKVASYSMSLLCICMHM